MEEPPKIERLISSRGITLSDASNILKSYVAIIDHGPHKPSSSTEDGIDTPSSSNNHGGDDTDKRSRQDIAEEREEERLLARLNQLDPKESNNHRLGSISEDVFERLRMIMESVSGEAEGRVVSAVGVYHASSKSKGGEQGGENDEGGDDIVKEELDDGQDEFLKELQEAERLETEQLQEPKVEEEEQPQQQQQQIDYEQKKKDKKAKKAAKKAKKEAKKRKASSGGANEEKRIKVEEDQD